jgi:hypothetical protein
VTVQPLMTKMTVSRPLIRAVSMPSAWSSKFRSACVGTRGGGLSCDTLSDVGLERVMNSIRNGLEMRETEIARGPS